MRRALFIGVLMVGCGADPAPPGGPAGDTSGGLDAIGQDTATPSDVLDDAVVADVADLDVTDVKEVRGADTGPDVQETTDTKDTVDTKDTAETKDTKDAGPVDAVAEDTGPVNGFTWVRIDDDPDNASLKVCLDVYASPGADIDAVALFRDGELLGYGDVVITDLNKDPHGKGKPCQNDYTDGDEAAGGPDAGDVTGSVSLNGGSLLVQFEGAPEILEGDIISVFEAGAGAVGVPESWFLSIGVFPKLAGEWIPLGGKHEGSQDVTVDF